MNFFLLGAFIVVASVPRLGKLRQALLLSLSALPLLSFSVSVLLLRVSRLDRINSLKIRDLTYSALNSEFLRNAKEVDNFRHPLRRHWINTR